MKKKAVCCQKGSFFLGCWSFATLLWLAHPLFAQVYSFETKHLRLIYSDQNHGYLAPHVASCFENALEYHRRLFNYVPLEKIVIIMNDSTDYGRADVNTAPWNHLRLGLEPFDYVYGTAPTYERMNWIMHQELAHLAAMDKSMGFDKFTRKLFRGKVDVSAESPLSIFYSLLTNPRLYAPRWYNEGMAVFLKTWMAGGFDRALNGHDEMLFRAMVRDGVFSDDLVELEAKGATFDFQSGNLVYLYGTRFLSYLTYAYEPEKILQWLNRAETIDSRLASTQFEQVYNVSLENEWSQWISWERKWQQANLDSIRLRPITPDRKVITTTLGAGSRAYYDTARLKLYLAIFPPGHLAQIAAVDLKNGKVEKLCGLPTPAPYYVASVAYDASTSTLFYTADNRQGWRDIWSVNVETGKTKSLLKDCRIGDLVLHPIDKSLWGMRHHDGLSSLVRLPPPYNNWQNVITLDYGKDIYDLDISPDGATLIAAYAETNGRQQLIKMAIAKLLEGEIAFETFYEFGSNAPGNFIFSQDGKCLYGTSYHSGVSNVYRYDFATKEMAAITNAETGFFRPAPISQDSLFVYRFTTKGFVPVVISAQPLASVKAIKYLGQAIVEKHSNVKNLMAGQPSDINIDSLVTYEGEYHLVKNIKLASAYPLIENYKGFDACGLRFNFQDPLARHALDFTVSYALQWNPSSDQGVSYTLPANERFHLNAKYRRRPWSVKASYNRADFYDFFSPTKTSLKGFALDVEYEKLLLHEAPRSLSYTVKLAGYRGLDRLPDYPNVFISFDKLLTAGASLNYKNLRQSLGAVEEDQGSAWHLNFRGHYVDAKFFPQFYAGYDYGLPLPIKHSSLWLRCSAGYALGGPGKSSRYFFRRELGETFANFYFLDPEEPFANFYFGGFGNNFLDHREIRRYRTRNSFPGAELNEIAGKNYGKLLLEWTLPPRRFESLRRYCRWVRPSLFATGILTNFDNAQPRRKLMSVGFQVDAKIPLIKSTFSMGYAAALEKHQPPDVEFMVSLRVLE